MSKLKSTCTDALPACVNPAAGRVHTSYHQAVAASGRAVPTGVSIGRAAALRVLAAEE